jgi:copper chaperone CopZ
VRGALKKVTGVKDADISPGKAEIVVRFDPDATTVDKVLAGLAAGGQPANKK